MSDKIFANLSLLAQHLRNDLQNKQFILLYAYNSVGKTRLSTAFKDLGKVVTDEGEVTASDTLYFNAFTEDMFVWDNDLDNDKLRVLELNTRSTFFDGLEEFEIENRVRTLLNRFADFEFNMDLIYEEPSKDEVKPRLQQGQITFSRDVLVGGKSTKIENIKISRSEENIFVWCFFLAVAELALDKSLAAYNWVKYIYIDDPISSLDDQNAVQVAVHLAHVLNGESDSPHVVISTHHPLFHSVLWNELRGKKVRRMFFGYDEENSQYTLRDTAAVPFFHHVAVLKQLYTTSVSGEITKHHFNMLRAIAEKAASFHGYGRFEDCLHQDKTDLDGKLQRRFLNLHSHGGHSHFDSAEVQEADKQHFREILHALLHRFAFNPEHFPGLNSDGSEDTATP